jgi:murein L,D-transpeptidase YafK
VPAEPAASAESKVRTPTSWHAGDVDATTKSRQASDRKLAEVKGLFAEAGVAFPPSELYLRAFKTDRELEVWAAGQRGERMELIATYGICALSGTLGRKRREGDQQVPEGFYAISYFWPDESFHLAAKVSYPNPFDRAQNGPNAGGDIMIHGGCASIGCIALSDERIEEIWVMGEPLRRNGTPIEVHIFPARDIPALLADPQLAEHHAFWRTLDQGLERFDEARRPPSLVSTAQGPRVH